MLSGRAAVSIILVLNPNTERSFSVPWGQLCVRRNLAAPSGVEENLSETFEDSGSHDQERNSFIGNSGPAGRAHAAG
jgi:hypothetical protein